MRVASPASPCRPSVDETRRGTNSTALRPSLVSKVTCASNSCKMFGKLVVFLVGMYAGIYADQHYQLPKIDDPKALWKKVEEFAEKYKKENPGPSKSD